jgi:hypothetical protein
MLTLWLFQAGHNPASQLVVGPKPTFTSRYADPNNPSNSGDMLALLTAGKLSMPKRGGFGIGAGGLGGLRGFGGRGMGMGGGFGGLGGNRIAMSYGSGMGGFGGRGMPMGLGGTNQQQYGPNQHYPNQQYANQQYPNEQYPNQQNPNQTGAHGGGPMMGPGIGFGGTMLLGEGIKRILRHVSLFSTFPVHPPAPRNQLGTEWESARPIPPHSQHADR